MQLHSIDWDEEWLEKGARETLGIPEWDAAAADLVRCPEGTDSGVQYQAQDQAFMSLFDPGYTQFGALEDNPVPLFSSDGSSPTDLFTPASAASSLANSSPRT